MSEVEGGLSETLFLLPADARLMAVTDLSLRLQAKIGPAPPGHVVVSRPGFRVTTRLVSPELARLMDRFREPRSFVEAVLDFSQAEARDPFATLEDAFDALTTLVDGRLLVPADSPESRAIAPSLAAGQAFGRYEIVDLVQALEDSEVYRALAPDETPAALKIVRSAATLSLAREARVLALLDGGDTPLLLETGHAGGREFIAMEWRPGAPIAGAAEQARATGDRRRQHALVSALLAAYGRLHARGVVHGDIHPGNILVAEDGRVTLLDFGRARLHGGDGVDLSRAGIAHFYEPEMAAALCAGRLPPAVTARGEQAGVAALAYLLLTGLPPVDATAEHQELLARIATRPPLPFAARGIDAWPQAERVLARALSKDPAARFADMAAFAEAFAAAAPTRRRDRRPLAADAVLAAGLQRAQQVWADAAEPEALRLAWLALRAALARSDPDLLAAADVWAARAGDSWIAWAVRADVARARCDRSGEVRALETFTQRAPPGDAPLSVLARLLDGAGAREVEPTPFAAWAADRLYAGVVAGRPVLRHHLALARAGVLPLPSGLDAALVALPAESGDAELWSLAHDAFAEPVFADRAAHAARRSNDVFDLLRLHQLTGDAAWLRAARREAHAAACRLPSGSSDLSIALRLVELEVPARAVRPPFELA
jgi:serine/threonine-protein kinase